MIYLDEIFVLQCPTGRASAGISFGERGLFQSGHSVNSCCKRVIIAKDAYKQTTIRGVMHMASSFDHPKLMVRYNSDFRTEMMITASTLKGNKEIKVGPKKNLQIRRLFNSVHGSMEPK